MERTIVIGVVVGIATIVFLPYIIRTTSSALGYNTATQISQQE